MRKQIILTIIALLTMSIPAMAQDKAFVSKAKKVQIDDAKYNGTNGTRMIISINGTAVNVDFKGKPYQDGNVCMWLSSKENIGYLFVDKGIAMIEPEGNGFYIDNSKGVKMYYNIGDYNSSFDISKVVFYENDSSQSRTLTITDKKKFYEYLDWFFKGRL